MTGCPVTPSGSPILEMARRAAEYRAEGRRVIDLTLGEPDFAPPAHAVLAAQEAAARPLGYTLPTGYRNCARPHGTRWNETAP